MNVEERTYGLVRTLASTPGTCGVVEPGPRYALGIALLRLGDVAGRQLPLSQVTAPVLQDLSRETGLTIRVAVVDNGYPVFVDRVDALGAVRFHALRWAYASSRTRAPRGKRSWQRFPLPRSSA